MKITIPELSLVVLVGPSGCGKSTFARKHFKPTEVLSSDYCRGLVSDDENDQSATRDAFAVLHFIAAKRLAAGRLTVVDATKLQKAVRAIEVGLPVLLKAGARAQVVAKALVQWTRVTAQLVRAGSRVLREIGKRGACVALQVAAAAAASVQIEARIEVSVNVSASVSGGAHSASAALAASQRRATSTPRSPICAWSSRAWRASIAAIRRKSSAVSVLLCACIVSASSA